MARKKQKDVECGVVTESIKGTLKQKTILYFGKKPEYYVQCDQEDCQHVDENRPPCPLTVDMFEEELKEMEERRRARKEERG
ncbi:MAG: hypothetical protein V3S46_08860 [Nitrospinota bacterium]